MNVYELGVVLSLRDMGSSALRDADERWKKFRSTVDDTDLSVKKFDKSIASMNKGKVLAGIGIAMALSMQPALDAAVKFDAAMGMLKATSGASAAEMDRFKTAALEAGIATQFSPHEAVEGLTALASAGMDATNSIKALNPVLDFAAASAGTVGINESAKDIASTMNVFKNDAQKVTDVFVQMANVSTYEIGELGAAWRGVNQIQAQAHQKIESMAAVMSALKQSGQTAVGSGEKLRMALSSLLTPSANAKKELSALGVSVYDQRGKFRDVIDIFADLQSATSKLSEKDRNARLEKILMTEGMSAFNAVQSAGLGTVREWVKEFQNAEGSARRFAATNQDTAAGAVKQLRGSVETLLVVMGQGLVPLLKITANTMTALLGPVLAFLQSNSKMAEYASVVFSTIAAVLILTGAVNLLSGAYGWLGIMMKKNIFFGAAYQFIQSSLVTTGSLLNASLLWTSGVLNTLGLSTAAATVKNWAMTVSQWALNTAMYANPVGIVIAAIVALIAVTALAIIYWDYITSAVKNAWNEHKNLITAVSLLFPPIGALVVAVRLLADNWDRVTSAMGTVWGWIQKLAGVNESELTLKRADSLRAEVDVLKEKQESLKDQGLKESDLYKNTAKAISQKQAEIKKLDSSTDSLKAKESALMELEKKRANLQNTLKEASSESDKKKIISSLASVEKDIGATKAGQSTDALKKAQNDLKGSSEKLKADAKKSGSATMDAFAEGINTNDAVKNALQLQFKNAAVILPHSDAEEGPFSRLTESGRAVMTTMAAGIKDAGSGLKNTLLNAFNAFSLDIPVPEFAGMGGVNPVGASIIPSLKFEFQNMIGEIIFPDGNTGRGRIIDLEGMIAAQILKAAEKKKQENKGGSK